MILPGGAPRYAGHVGGFTLVEALIAALLGLFVLVMSLSVLQVQSRLQTRVTESVARQSVLDFASGVVAEELRPVADGGIIYARADSVAFRRPLLIGQFCATTGSSSHMYFPLDGETLPTAQVGGIAIRDGDGDWINYDASWSDMGITFSTSAAAACAAAGADTARISRDFATLPYAIPAGKLFSVYQVRGLSIRDSELDDSSLGLFVGGTGELTQEMATGLLDGTALAYRHRDGYYLTAPTNAQLGQLDGVRFTALASATERPDAPKQSWTVDIRLLNAVF